MKKENLFYVIFIAAIFLIRFSVFLFPTHKLIIAGTLIHHFWLGVLFVVLATLFFKKQKTVRLSVLAVGLAWISDELVYMLVGAGPVSNYWMPYSVIGMVVCVLIVLFASKKLIKKI